MLRERVVRVALAVVVLASLGACAEKKDAGVALRAESVDLVYGKKVETLAGEPQGGVVGGPPGAPGPAGVIEVEEELDQPRSRPFTGNSNLLPPAPARAAAGQCNEPPDDAEPSEPAPPRIEKAPSPGDYWSQFEVPGQEAKRGYRRIDADRPNQTGVFDYTITDGFTGQKMGFEVDPKEGMSLTQIGLVREGEPVTVTPIPPVRILNFPILPDSRGEVSSVSSDPATQTLVQFTGTPRGKERITVCSVIVEAWKIDWDLQVQVRNLTHHEVGAVYLLTQAGGWPVQSVLEVTGDFREQKETLRALRIVAGRVSQ